MAPRTPLLHPRAYFEERGFDTWPALAAVGTVILALTVSILGLGFLLSGRLRAAGYDAAALAVWNALVGQLLVVVFFLLLGWVLVTAVLHFLARAALTHEGTFGETFAVVGWGVAPSALSTLVGFALVALALNDASLATPETFLDQFRANLAATGVVRGAVSFLVAGWQTYVYAHGLAVEFDADTGLAALVGGAVAYGFWLLNLI